MGADLRERDLERGLLDHLRELILELGKRFAFVGSQYHLEVGGQDFYLDLLFYHLRLRCFVVLELKIEEFKPEFAGKMNFYLSAVDAQLRHPDDQPTIGIIICRGRNEVIVEYALRDSSKPIGVTQYRLSSALPPPLQQALPTIDELAREFPALALLNLRADIERALIVLMRSHGIEGEAAARPSIFSQLRALHDVGVPLRITDEFLNAVEAMHAAVHGAEVAPAQAAQTIEQGRVFLAHINGLIGH